jgi:hypothetical protein
MRRKIAIGLVLLNGLLAAFLFSPQAETQVMRMGLLNCCKSDGAPKPYCGDSCCWFTWNCNRDRDCAEVTELKLSK